MPLLQFRPTSSHAKKGVIWRWSIWIDVCEPARENATTTDFVQGFLRRFHHASMELWKPLPGNRTLGRIRNRPNRGHGSHLIGHADEGITPLANRTAPPSCFP